MNPTQTINFDPSVIALSKAFIQHESGGSFTAKGASGEYGAAQWLPNTWAGQAKDVLGYVPKFGTAEMTPEIQKAVLSSVVNQDKQNGLNPAQIAAKWNSGSPTGWENKIGTNSMGVKYNVPAYVKSVTDLYQQYKTQTPDILGTPTAEASTGTTPPPQPSFLNNVVSSAGNLLGGFGNAVMHPLDTLGNLANTAVGAGESALNTVGANFNNPQTQAFGNLVDYFGKRYGGSSPSEIIGNIGNTFYKDPVGAALDLSTLLDGVGAGLGAVGKIADVSKATELAKASDFISTTSGILKGGSPEAIKALQTDGTLTKVASAVKTVADYTNPLKPVTSAISGTANKISQLSDALPRRIINNLLPQLKTAGLKDYAIENLKVGSVDNMLKTSEDAINNYDSQINTILKHPDNAGLTVNGSDIVNKTLSQFPNSEYTPEQIISKVKSQIPANAKLVTKLENGSLSLDEANTLRQAADRASYKLTIDSPEVRAGKEILSNFGNVLREQVKTLAPETRPIFDGFKKEIDLNKALIKLSEKSGNKGIVSTKELLAALTANGITGPIGAGAFLTGEKILSTPAARVLSAKALNVAKVPVKAIAKGVIKSTKVIKPLAVAGRLSNASNGN